MIRNFRNNFNYLGVAAKTNTPDHRGVSGHDAPNDVPTTCQLRPEADRPADQHGVLPNGLSSQILDLLDCGIFILDARRRVRYANVVASDILASGLLVMRERTRELTCSLPNDVSALQDFLSRSATTPPGDTVATLRLEGASEDAVTIVAVSHHLLAGQEQTNTYILLFCVREHSAHRIASWVTQQSQLDGYTRTEALVLSRLFEGLSIKDTAQDLGIREVTARNHLAHMMSKSGARSQADLLRRHLLRRIPVLLPDEDRRENWSSNAKAARAHAPAQKRLSSRRQTKTMSGPIE